MTPILNANAALFAQPLYRDPSLAPNLHRARMEALLDDHMHDMRMVEDCLFDAVAEDTSEARAFGDGPCGSVDRRHRLSEVSNYLKTLGESASPSAASRHPLRRQIPTSAHSEAPEPGTKKKPRPHPGREILEIEH